MYSRCSGGIQDSFLSTANEAGQMKVVGFLSLVMVTHNLPDTWLVTGCSGQDPNTGKSMYESDDIIAYLFKEYGDGQIPLVLRLGPLTMLTCALSGLARWVWLLFSG